MVVTRGWERREEERRGEESREEEGEIRLISITKLQLEILGSLLFIKRNGL
jgi:hypothetical protein